jgi:8-oxo-dGTP pyrophosphatase MutT (NUDIX family)
VTLHGDAVDVLTRWQAPTEEQEQLRAAYVAHLAEHPDGVWRSCLPAHLTAGALVLSHDRRHVLLNLHRKAGRWFHFGGHLEPGDVTLAGAALREATEESGLSGLQIDSDPVHLSRHAVEFCGAEGTADHLDVRFLALLGTDTEPEASDESLDVRWWPVDGLPTDEPDMVEMIELGLLR